MKLASLKLTAAIGAVIALAGFGAISIAVPGASAQQADARVRVLHASPDAPAVDVYVDGSEAISDLEFNEITDYVKLPAGSHNVKVYPASAGGSGTPVIAADLTLTAGADYTVAAVGQLASIEPLVLQDANAAPAAGKARLRFVHASPDAPAVDIYAEGAGVVVPNAAFKQASGYLDLAAATYNLEVRAAGTTTVALALPNITLEAGKTYTAFATGLLQGTPALGAKLTVDAVAAAPVTTPAGSLPSSGGPQASGNSAASWLVMLGAILVAAGIGGAAFAVGRVRAR